MAIQVKLIYQKRTTSGLDSCATSVRSNSKIAFAHFEAGDVVRHPVVADIIRAYEESDSKRTTLIVGQEGKMIIQPLRNFEKNGFTCALMVLFYSLSIGIMFSSVKNNVDYSEGQG